MECTDEMIEFVTFDGTNVEEISEVIPVMRYSLTHHSDSPSELHVEVKEFGGVDLIEGDTAMLSWETQGITRVTSLKVIKPSGRVTFNAKCTDLIYTNAKEFNPWV